MRYVNVIIVTRIFLWWCSEKDWFKFASTSRTYTTYHYFLYVSILVLDTTAHDWDSFMETTMDVVTSQWGYKLQTDANSPALKKLSIVWMCSTESELVSVQRKIKRKTGNFFSGRWMKSLLLYIFMLQYFIILIPRTSYFVIVQEEKTYSVITWDVV